MKLLIFLTFLGLVLVFYWLVLHEHDITQLQHAVATLQAVATPEARP